MGAGLTSFHVTTYHLTKRYNYDKVSNVLDISYNFSKKLKDTLEKIEILKRRILLTPLNPKTELLIRFDANVNRIYWTFNLKDNSLTKPQILKLLTSQNLKKLTSQEKEAIAYKKGLDYISHEWLVTKRPVKVKDVFNLCEIIGSKKSIPQEPLRKVLEYLEITTDHPIIQAAVAYLQIASLANLDDKNQRLCNLVSYLFLYKSGYDFRGLLVLEKYWKKTLNNTAATLWFEYFATSVMRQLAEAAEKMSSLESRREIPSFFWELKDRQKEIMLHLEIPNATIANKKVQSLFKVSQITASRDLARLVTLGILFSHGKGRSTYYTRV